MNYDYLVAKANDEPSKNDKFCVSCFTLIGSLVCLTKCEEYKLTKPQGLTLHVTVPETTPHGFQLITQEAKFVCSQRLQELYCLKMTLDILMFARK